MLTVDKINTNINNKINFTSTTSAKRQYSFGNEADAWRAYIDMNRDVYKDYADGDISLISFIGDKFKGLWAILTAKDPTLEIKEQMIEESLLNQAQREFAEPEATAQTKEQFFNTDNRRTFDIAA